MVPYRVIEPQYERVPVILSIPHCGTTFPDEIRNELKPDLTSFPDDTDWFVDQLYDFAPELGITVIHAVYSRWVIDLNRPPDNTPLYKDGRLITGLCPVTTFLGEPLYRDERKEIQPEEVQRRLQTYYWPYHEKLTKLLTSLKNDFGSVLLWDCHSIRQHVPTIHPEKFPDLILGDAGGTSASPGLIEIALRNLEHSGFSVSHNHPFSGGYITRHYGKPSDNQHALQLEMSKVVYMDDAERTYHPQRAEKIRRILRKTLDTLSQLVAHS
ncbi:MAG: N-formylglutamate amidohydrolase [Cyclobacteriaceae bacterium]|nr:N-formylglutamate amidohydrolase [Cyclobacteriaceae bacterium]MCX7636923.1 N-formylglutamate amidohydrolase [Cyclobacteriaceae bacterium]MDW8330380.1 N-formylglutamate amidohydrolase [Cyclobacteriaceae bacterium]